MITKADEPLHGFITGRAETQITNNSKELCDTAADPTDGESTQH